MPWNERSDQKLLWPGSSLADRPVLVSDVLANTKRHPLSFFSVIPSLIDVSPVIAFDHFNEVIRLKSSALAFS